MGQSRQDGELFNGCFCSGVKNAASTKGMAFGAEKGRPFNELEATGHDVGSWGEGEVQEGSQASSMVVARLT